MSVELANGVFDILATEGNHDKEYIDYHREEFINKMTNGNGANEHWYPTNSGSSIKVYFRWYARPEVTVYAQTINPIHEKDLVENTARALDTLIAGIHP